MPALTRRAEVIDSQDVVLTQLCKSLVAAGIDLPFPTQQVLFHDQTEATDGDRTKQKEGWPAASDNNPLSRRIGQSIRQSVRQLAAGNNSNSRGRKSEVNSSRSNPEAN